MKKSRFTEEQILFALKSAQTGKAVGDVCRQMSVLAAHSQFASSRRLARQSKSRLPPI